MAKVKGGLHSDLVKGSVGPVTHRLYRGVGTASKHRSPSRKRLTKLWIKSPLDIGNCWSRHSADINHILRYDGDDAYLVSLADQSHGFGALSQSDLSFQPLWFSSDPARNNRPYILPDGVDDFLKSVPLAASFFQPFEIWMVASTAGLISSRKVLVSFSEVADAFFAYYGIAAVRYYWTLPSVLLLGGALTENVVVWRLVLTASTIQLFVNGTPLTAPKAFSNVPFRNLRLFCERRGVYLWEKKLFEITTYRRILNPVESQLLLSFYFDLYNLP